jgi:hypothetical protein
MRGPTMTPEDSLYNLGLIKAQWHITKAMLALEVTNSIDKETKSLLKFIHDEIQKEIKE